MASWRERLNMAGWWGRHGDKAERAGLIVVAVLVFLAFLGVAATLGYLSIWLMLVGGIVDIINQFKAAETDAGVVAWAVVKVAFFEIPLVVGIWLVPIGGAVSLGVAFSGGDSPVRRRKYRVPYSPFGNRLGG